MRWEESVPSNLFRIAGIPVDRSSDKQVKHVWLYLQVVLISLSKHIRTNFQLSLVSGTAHLLHHNRCLFLRMWCWKDT